MVVRKHKEQLPGRLGSGGLERSDLGVAQGRDVVLFPAREQHAMVTRGGRILFCGHENLFRRAAQLSPVKLLQEGPGRQHIDIVW